MSCTKGEDILKASQMGLIETLENPKIQTKIIFKTYTKSQLKFVQLNLALVIKYSL